jgi:hypothetical protein
MNKGKIEMFLGQTKIVYAEQNKENKTILNHLPIHPHFKNYIFREGQEVFFQYGKECTLHYPKLCDCMKMELYAIPIFKKQKLNLKYIIQQIFKKLFKLK